MFYSFKLLTALVLSLAATYSSSVTANSTFSFHLLGEPYTLDPLKASGSAGSYLYSNLFHGLYTYHPDQGLVPNGARECVNQGKKKMTCILKPKKWSNGKVILAKHYVTAFRRLADPNEKSPQIEALLNLKNAKKILEGKEKPDNLGVHAPDDKTLIFEFDQPDPEFRFKLTLPATAPIYSLPLPSREKSSTLVTNGPYQIESWQKGKKIRLKPNSYFERTHRAPPVEIFFVEDDSTALNLYLSGRLTFLRRLVSDKIEIYKDRPDFFQVPVARFDYIGFGPRFKNQLSARRAMSQSLNYQKLQDIYKALGPPGCPSLPRELQSEVHCHNFQSDKAQVNFKKNKGFFKRPLSLAYSKMGGEDIQKGMEWVQHQWKINLGIEVDLKPQEQGYYIRQLQDHRFDMFRKGVGLDRPTCLAALEIFLPNHPENYIQLNDNIYNQRVKKLERSIDPAESKVLCSFAIQRLIDQSYIIPLGEIHFTILASQNFRGWTLNSMNQLDLSDLHRHIPTSQ